QTRWPTRPGRHRSPFMAALQILRNAKEVLGEDIGEIASLDIIIQLVKVRVENLAPQLSGGGAFVGGQAIVIRKLRELEQRPGEPKKCRAFGHKLAVFKSHIGVGNVTVVLINGALRQRFIVEEVPLSGAMNLI